MRAAIAAACLASLTIHVIENYVKNSPQIAGGVIGAVIGFVGTLLTLELVGFGNRADPVGSGLLALFVFAPAGAIAGLVTGTTLAMRMRGSDNAGSLAVAQSECRQPCSRIRDPPAGRNGTAELYP